MDTTKKTHSSRLVFWILGGLMAMTAVYMTIVIKTVPRTVESSKIGPFPALIERIIDFHSNPPANLQDGKVWDKDAVNLVMKELAPYEGLAMKRAAVDFELLTASLTKLDERNLLQLRLKHPEGTIFTLSMFPISKRHFPKTHSFVYKDAWFFQYGKDLQGSPAPEQSVIPGLVSRNLNMVATNYGNDFYLVLTGEAPAKELGKWLFDATTIFSPRK